MQDKVASIRQNYSPIRRPARQIDCRPVCARTARPVFLKRPLVHYSDRYTEQFHFCCWTGTFICSSPMGRGNDKSGMNKMSYGILGTGATCISNARQHVSIGRLPLDSQCDVWPPSHDLYAFRRLILLLIFFFLYPVMFVLLSIFRLHPSAQQRSIFPRTFFLKYNKKRKKISNIACLRHQSHPLVARRDVPSLLLFLF